MANKGIQSLLLLKALLILLKKGQQEEVIANQEVSTFPFDTYRPCWSFLNGHVSGQKGICPDIVPWFGLDCCGHALSSLTPPPSSRPLLGWPHCSAVCLKPNVTLTSLRAQRGALRLAHECRPGGVRKSYPSQMMSQERSIGIHQEQVSRAWSSGLSWRRLLSSSGTLFWGHSEASRFASIETPFRKHYQVLGQKPFCWDIHQVLEPFDLIGERCPGFICREQAASIRKLIVCSVVQKVLRGLWWPSRPWFSSQTIAVSQRAQRDFSAQHVAIPSVPEQFHLFEPLRTIVSDLTSAWETFKEGIYRSIYLSISIYLYLSISIYISIYLSISLSI